MYIHHIYTSNTSINTPYTPYICPIYALKQPIKQPIVKFVLYTDQAGMWRVRREERREKERRNYSASCYVMPCAVCVCVCVQ